MHSCNTPNDTIKDGRSEPIPGEHKIKGSRTVFMVEMDAKKYKLLEKSEKSSMKQIVGRFSPSLQVENIELGRPTVNRHR